MLGGLDFQKANSVRMETLDMLRALNGATVQAPPLLECFRYFAYFLFEVPGLFVQDQ